METKLVGVKSIIMFVLVTLIFCLVAVPILLVSLVWWTTVVIGAIIFQKNKLSTTVHSLERAQILIDKKIQTEPGIVITIPVTIRGIVDVDKFKKIFESSLMKNQNGRERQTTYKKFQQYPVSWMGYLFYAWDDNFDINRHIKKLDERVLETNIDTFLSKRSRLQFPPKSSMWEIILVHNYNEEDNTLLIIRLHHSVSDGMSILKLLKKLDPTTNVSSDIPKQTIFTANTESNTLLEKIRNTANCVVSLPSILAAMSIKCENIPLGDENSGCELFARTKAFSLENLKIAKAAAGVSLTAIILHTLSAALRKFIMDKYGLENMPKALSVTHIIPKDDHPDNTLTNHYRHAHISLPISKEDNLAECDEQHKDSVFKAKGLDAEKVLHKLMNILPNFIFKALLPNMRNHIGIAITNVVGPSENISIFDYKVLDMNFFVGCLDNPWILLSILSYNGNIRIGICGKSHVFSDNEHLLAFRNDFERIMDEFISSYII